MIGLSSSTPPKDIDLNTVFHNDYEYSKMLTLGDQENTKNNSEFKAKLETQDTIIKRLMEFSFILYFLRINIRSKTDRIIKNIFTK